MDADLPTQIEHLKGQQASLFRAAKISLLLILLTVDWVCISAVISTKDYRKIFSALMEGPALPSVTTAVFDHFVILLTSAITLGAVGLGLILFSKTRAWSIVAVTVIIVMLFLEWQLVASAMQAPLMFILHGIGSDEKS